MQIRKPLRCIVWRSAQWVWLWLAGVLLLGCGARDDTRRNSHANRIVVSESAININTARAAELERLPGVGEQRALEIIKHRETFGEFRRPEHLLLVRGISDEHLRQIRGLIKVE